MKGGGGRDRCLHGRCISDDLTLQPFSDDTEHFEVEDQCDEWRRRLLIQQNLTFSQAHGYEESSADN